MAPRSRTKRATASRANGALGGRPAMFRNKRRAELQLSELARRLAGVASDRLGVSISDVADLALRVFDPDNATIRKAVGHYHKTGAPID